MPFRKAIPIPMQIRLDCSPALVGNHQSQSDPMTQLEAARKGIVTPEMEFVASARTSTRS